MEKSYSLSEISQTLETIKLLEKDLQPHIDSLKNPEVAERFRNNIRLMLRLKNLTHGKLATKLNYDRADLGARLVAKRKVSTIFLLKLCVELNIQPADLFVRDFIKEFSKAV
jgi:DNA-binding Xre family transcriptional regulator